MYLFSELSPITPKIIVVLFYNKIMSPNQLNGVLGFWGFGVLVSGFINGFGTGFYVASSSSGVSIRS